MTLPNLKCFLLFHFSLFLLYLLDQLLHQHLYFYIHYIFHILSSVIESKLDVAPNVAHSLQITRNPVNKVQPFLIITKFNEKLRLGNLEIILIIEKTFGNKSTTLK